MPNEAFDFGINYRVTGHADRALRDVENGLRRVNREASRSEGLGVFTDKNGRLRDARGRFVGTGKAASQMASEVSKAIESTSLALRDSSMQLTAWGSDLMSTLENAARTGIQHASTVETSNAQMAFSIRKIGLDAKETADKIDEISLKTALTRSELTGMVSELAMNRINVFDERLSHLTATMADGSKQALSAAEVIQDMVSASGKDVNSIMRGIREAAAEQKLMARQGLGDFLNLGPQEIKKWNAEMKKAKDSQDAFNRLMALSAERVGGATGSVSSTLGFAIQQIDDWIEKVNSELFKGALPIVRDLVMEIGEWVLSLTKDDGLRTVRDEITLIATQMAAAARRALELTKATVEFVRQHPWILRVAVYMGLFSAAMSKVVGSLGRLGALLFNLRSLFAAIGPGLMAFIPIAVKIGVVVAALGIIATFVARAVVGGDSIADTWGRVWEVLKGVFTVVKNMDLKTGLTFIDDEQAKKLEDLGLLDTVITIGKTILRVSKFFEGMFTSFERAWPRIQEAGGRIFDNISKAVENLARAIGANMDDVGLSLSGAPDSAVDKWISMGMTIGDIIVRLIELFTMLIETASEFAAKASEVMDSAPVKALGKVVGAAQWIGEHHPGRMMTTSMLGVGQNDLGPAFNDALAKVSVADMGREAAVASLPSSSPGGARGADPAMAKVMEMAAAAGGPSKSTFTLSREAEERIAAAAERGLGRASVTFQGDGREMTDWIAKHARRSEEDEG